MDGKILYGGDVAMLLTTKRNAKLFLFSVILAVALVFSLAPAQAADIEPGRTMSTEIKPVLSGIQVMQLGGDSVLIRLRGHELPHPRTVSAPGESKLVLQWDEVRFPQRTDKRDWWDNYDWDVLMLDPGKQDKWWKQYDTSVIERINAEPVDEKSVRLTFTSTKPLMVQRIEGQPGAESTAILLKIYEPPRKAEAPKPVKAPAKGDPMAITAPVTLQLRDVDVKSVFRMLAEQQKINLLLDTSVPDGIEVTLSFNGVPYNEAFSYLLRMTGLDYSMVGNMLVVGKTASLGKTLGREIVRGYQLSYAIKMPDEGLNNKVEVRGELVAALTDLLQLSTPPTLDERNRVLYVTATPEQHVEVAELLARLDKPGRQVMIQAKIIEVTDDGKQDLEMLVSSVYEQWLFNFSPATGLRVGYDYINSGASPSVKSLNAGLTALETQNKGKVIAHPSIIAVDGEYAEVELITKNKYPSGTDSNGNISFSDEETGPKLKFRPSIGRDGVMSIRIEIETGEIIDWKTAGNYAEVPITAERKVETLVRVRDGEPFAVGGLFQENKTKSRQRIPVLGYIPFLGDLFTTRHENHHKSELAMIVIPYILDIPDGEIETFDLSKSSLIR